MIRRVMAITSSVLFAAGTTPMPMGAERVSIKSTARNLAPKPRIGTNATTTTNSDPPTVDFHFMIGRLRDQRRLSEVHYAVSNNTLLPIVQDRTLSHRVAMQQRTKTLQLAEKTAQKMAQSARKTAKSQHSLPYHSPVRRNAYRRLSARGGGSLLPGATVDELGVQAAGLALSLVGTPYRWGGESRAGFDCSGLVQYVYRKLGTVLPRTTYEQFRGGQEVSFSSLQPGDLVFFTTNAAGPSHVAIYVGNGLIVHALNQSVGVIVSRLSDDYYASRFVGARRLVH